jgi:hypothetical protein
MCDYSLAYFPNRLAVEGEQLVVHRFATRTLGLAPAGCGWKQLLFPSRLTAVCVPPGARLRLYDMPEDLQRRLSVGAVEEVTFDIGDWRPEKGQSLPGADDDEAAYLSHSFPLDDSARDGE